MDKDQIEGAARQAEGGVEEALGELMDGNEDRGRGRGREDRRRGGRRRGLGPGCCRDVI